MKWYLVLNQQQLASDFFKFVKFFSFSSFMSKNLKNAIECGFQLTLKKNQNKSELAHTRDIEYNIYVICFLTPI